MQVQLAPAVAEETITNFKPGRQLRLSAMAYPHRKNPHAQVSRVDKFGDFPIVRGELTNKNGLGSNPQK